jgi:hypothetical protein
MNKLRKNIRKQFHLQQAQKIKYQRSLVANACNPSYSRGSKKPDWSNSSQEAISKNSSQK